MSQQNLHASRYTVVAPTPDGTHLLYHTASGAFADLDEEAYQEFLACSGDSLDKLEEAGFLTRLSPEEELSCQRAIFDTARADSSALILSIIPTYACNYRCPYCYELGHNKIQGKMDKTLMDAICAFIQNRYDALQFSRLEVQWYGGDPSLALDVVETLSTRITTWCDSHDVAYDALMLSNANLIDEAAAQLIASARISSVLLTIDGPEELHNKRRVAADGSNSYQRNIDAARYLISHGVSVQATMNVDRISWPLYTQLRDKLFEEEGIVLNAGKLCDYGKFFGTPPFSQPGFDLMTHEEFAQARLDLFAQESHTVQEMKQLLVPINRFCSGQSDNYFVIDLLGDVYNCDGWVGDKAYVRFNLLESPDSWKLADISHDPTRDERCSQCELLPLCLGSCYWERACNEWPCHPFKYTLSAYLQIYRDCFSVETKGFTRLQ